MRSLFPAVLPESPVQTALKAGPRGNGEWPGFSHVYRAISQACDRMGLTPGVARNEFHVMSMADLGSGHEERMKARLQLLRVYGWA